jgi:hypothetical protein
MNAHSSLGDKGRKSFNLSGFSGSVNSGEANKHGAAVLSVSTHGEAPSSVLLIIQADSLSSLPAVFSFMPPPISF